MVGGEGRGGGDIVGVGGASPRWPVNFHDFPAGVLRSSGLEDPLQTELQVERTDQGLIIYQRKLLLEPVSGKGAEVKVSFAPVSDFSYLAWRHGAAMERVMDAVKVVEPISRSQTLESTLTATADFRIRFSVWWPEREGNKEAPKGLVLYQWGYNGYRFEMPLVRELNRRGWAVLTHNGFTWTRPSGVRIPSGKAERFLPDHPSTLEGKPAPGTAKGEDDRMPVDAAITSAGALAALEFDDAIGQYVLAHGAALAYVRAKEPRLRGLPLVVAGCSLGSLTTPALLTYLKEPVAACVMVGSGGNLLEILGRPWEDYFYSRARAGLPGVLSVPTAKRADLRRAYLAAATLDPLNRASALRGQPLLMVHAAWDKIVNAPLGDQLWEAAGRPERWVASMGHIRLFILLRFHVKEIGDWIDAAAAGRGGEPRLVEDGVARAPNKVNSTKEK